MVITLSITRTLGFSQGRPSSGNVQAGNKKFWLDLVINNIF